MRQSHAGLVSAVLYRVRGLVRLAPGSNPGYTFTFGAHDQAILTRSLVADIALPALLLAHIPRSSARVRPRQIASSPGVWCRAGR